MTATTDSGIGESPLIEETKQDILDDITATEADDSFSRFVFFFAPPVDGSYEFFERQRLGLGHNAVEPDRAVQNALHVFEEAGCATDYGDTVSFSFSLNRCWYSAKCNRCIRSFGYTLPAISDVNALAHLVDDVAKGRLLMFVKELEG